MVDGDRRLKLSNPNKPLPVGLSDETEWNGEPCKARRVLIRVGECPKPSWWFAALVGTEMRAVEVTQQGETFYIADGDGNGWHKVTKEGGGPHWGHKYINCAEVLKERTREDLDDSDCHCGGRP